MFWDIFDAVLGPVNYIDRLLGWTQIQFRRGSKRRKQPYSRTASVRITHPRCDKQREYVAIIPLRKHLAHYGVQTYAYTHDDRNFYFSVAKNQERQFRYLYNDGKSLRSFKNAWKDKPNRWWSKWL